LEGVVAAVEVGVGFLAGEEELRSVRVVVDGAEGGGTLTFFFTGEVVFLSGLDDAAAPLALDVEGAACLDALSLVVLGELVEGCWSSSW